MLSSASVSTGIPANAGISTPLTSAPSPVIAHGVDQRIAALDGLRGVLAFTVCISHYFGEVAHGVAGLMLGWIAVKVFFVLSGFLMARIILESFEAKNFFQVFYVRRLCRTLPAYLVTIAAVFACARAFQETSWMDADRLMPLWSYLTFTQPFVMISRGDFGSHWLIPTWTLTVEEQFYLFAPLIALIVPRRHLLAAILAGVALSIGFRAWVYASGTLPSMAALVTLPGACHSMFLGMAAALLLRSGRIDWAKLDTVLRVAPLLILAVVLGLKALDANGGRWFEIAGVPLVSIAGAIYLMSIVRGSPEAQRFEAAPLRWLGTQSYSLYLMHMPVLGLMHGLLLGTKPDIATAEQLAVTVLAVPVALLVAAASARWVEQPMIAYGRTWRWQKP